MPFFIRNNGTLTSPPWLSTAATIALGVGPLTPASPFPYGYSHAFGTSQLCAVWSWFNQIFLFRVFPDSLLGRRAWRSVRVLEYGDVLGDVVDPVLFLNTFRSPAKFALVGLTGSSAGIALTDPNYSPPVPPPNPPLPAPPAASLPAEETLQSGAQRLFDVLLDASNPLSTISLRVALSWDIDGTLLPFAFSIEGVRAPVFARLPDWGTPPRIGFSYKTDVFASDTRREQRTGTFQPAEGGIEGEVQHSFTLTYLLDGARLSTTFYNRLVRSKHRRCTIPWPTEILQAHGDAAGSAVVTIDNLPLSALLWRSSEMIRVDLRNPDAYESREVVGVDLLTGAITVDAPWGSSIPAKLQAFFFVRYVSLTKAPRRKNTTDTHQSITVTWESVD